MTLSPTGGGGSSSGGGGGGGYYIPLLSPTAKVGTWGFTGGSGPFNGGWWVNSTAAQNDSLTYPLYLSAGTYAIAVGYAKAPNAGIVSVNLAGIAVGTIDTFNGGTVNNNSQIFTGVAVGGTGATTLVLTVTSKNASASAFALNLHEISVYRTA